jgi:hypothetical protein
MRRLHSALSVGDGAELADNLRVAEVAGGGIPGPAEGDRADVAGLAGQRLARITAAFGRNRS